MAGAFFRVRVKTFDGPAHPANWTMRSDGMVRRDQRTKMRIAKSFAVMFAPMRTGRVKRSFTDRHVSHTPVSSTHILSNRAPYAKYLFTDTRGAMIVPKGTKKMPVGKSQMDRHRGATLTTAQLRTTVLKNRVRGYPANKAITNAMSIAFRRQGVRF